MLIPRAQRYEEIRNSFRWQIPRRYNIARNICERWARDPARLALIYEDQDGTVRTFTFRDIHRLANRCANVLTSFGMQRGERVSVLLGQRPECAVAHVGCWKAGLVSCPTSTLFGPDALIHRLNDSRARTLVTDQANLPKVEIAREQCPSLERVLLVDAAVPGSLDFHALLGNASEQFETVDTTAEEPAWISYTSGTTGKPKGAVESHRVMLGHVPSLEFVYDFFPQPGDTFWSPADWAWIAGLMDVLAPAWFHGCPVVATPMSRFDPERAFDVLGRHQVTLSLLTPTMLRLMRGLSIQRRPRGLKLRAVLSGGETVGRELIEWGREALGLTVHEAYGQTECNVFLGNNARVMPVKPGSVGRATPGSYAAIVDSEGHEVTPGTAGHIACRRPHPVMFSHYLNSPDATRDKFIGDWLITGDIGHMDEDGYFWFHGRADDVITSAGYRIGPGEIEDALGSHPSVQLAAAIGVPDPVRTEVIKAFIVPASGVTPDSTLADQLRDFVRQRLARHEVPRFIEFVDALPMTTNGKIVRTELRARERQRASGSGAPATRPGNV